jgi:site-specific recombinase XerD
VTSGKALNATLPAEKKLDRYLAVLEVTPDPSSLVELPSIEEFCETENIDRDFYSEAEIVQLMREHYHLDQPNEDGFPLGFAHHEVNAHVDALNALQTYLAKPVEETDLLDIWLKPNMVAKLREAKILSVGNLVNYINIHGERWYRKIPAMGESRAERIINWLNSSNEDSNAPQIRLQLHAKRISATVNGQIVVPEPAPRFGIVPVERLRAPESLSGRDGYLRVSGPNTLGADTDAEAIKAWLMQYEGRTKTLDAYKREIERFWLWCLIVKGKPLSSITSVDCAEYRAFLARPSADWVNPQPQPRTSDGWRPFRGPLDASSQKQALRIINIFYQSLVGEGYLIGNPISGTLRKVVVQRKSAAEKRGFTSDQWAFIQSCVNQVDDDIRRQRIDLLLQFLVTTGLRLDEITKANWGSLFEVDLDPDPLDPGTTKAWIIRVLGKGSVERDVPVPEALVAKVKSHINTALAKTDFSAMSELPPAQRQSLPLICTIEAPIGKAESPSSRKMVVGLSRSGIARTLKRFFTHVEKEAIRTGREDAARFGAASTHWLRHTFGRMALAEGAALDAVKEAMGHGSISTTSIYTTADRSRVVRELRKMQGRFGA